MNSIKVKVKKLHEDAKLPYKAKEGDFCYDVYAVSEEEVAPNVWRYGLGFAYEIERGTVDVGIREKGFMNDPSYVLNLNLSLMNIDIDFRPRSSVWKTGMVLSNSEGTLDEFYRGEAMAVYYHVFSDMPRYKVGDRVGQIKIGFTIPAEFEFVDEINMNTERGEGGFGSTGK